MGERETMTERGSLTNRAKTKKLLDMEKVYRQLDAGRTVDDVAKEWGVCKSTLYRRHKEYQELVRIMNQRKEEPEVDMDHDFVPPRVNFDE